MPLNDVRAQRIQLRDGDSIFVDAKYDYVRAQAYVEEPIKLANLQ